MAIAGGTGRVMLRIYQILYGTCPGNDGAAAIAIRISENALSNFTGAGGNGWTSDGVRRILHGTWAGLNGSARIPVIRTAVQSKTWPVQSKISLPQHIRASNQEEIFAESLALSLPRHWSEANLFRFCGR